MQNNAKNDFINKNNINELQKSRSYERDFSINVLRQLNAKARNKQPPAMRVRIESYTKNLQTSTIVDVQAY